MKLVYEDEYGAYLGVTPDFLKEFVFVDSNPHFDVLDSRDGGRRFITVKSSRIPDDERPAEGRFGIDFNRGKPAFEEARRYAEGLPESYQWQTDIAFAAADVNEYEIKSSVWNSFYSYIWDTDPQTVWVAPHSGKVERQPHDSLSEPSFMIDSFTAGAAASCAFRDTGKVDSRNMMAVHSTGQLGAVLNLGDFGVLEQEKMDSAAEKLIPKYREAVKKYAGEFKRDYAEKSLRVLENILRVRGTLDPNELESISGDDSFIINIYSKCLKLYGQETGEYSLEEFSRAFRDLDEAEVPVILNNFIYPGRNVGRLLGLSGKIREGLMHSAIVVECARVYLEKDPQLVSDITLDVKREIFG